MPKTIGTYERPISNPTPVNLAKSIIEDQFKTEAGRRGLFFWGGDYWAWEGGMWTIKGSELIEDLLWKWLDEAWVVKYTTKGSDTVKLDYSMALVGSIMRCLEGETRLPEGKIPRWLAGKDLPNPDMCIGFRDVMLDVKGSAESGQLVTAPRGEVWFDCLTVPYDLMTKEECPTWRTCCGQWGGNDPLWETCLKREMGYGLMAFRGLAKWFMHYGRSRAGKGTIETVRRGLMGNQAYLGLRMSSLGKNFGLHKLVRARAMVVSEVTELEKHLGEEASGLIKNLIGRDPIDLDRKYQMGLENVVSDAMVVIMGNELPNMPNKGRGMSSKMVPLNFDVTFEGKEDVELSMKLEKEMGGIARWAAEGAVEVLAEKDSSKRFPFTQGSHDAMAKYHILNNPADSFLLWGFLKREKGFVPSELVWNRYEEFSALMKIKPVARNQFNNWLEAQNSWGVVKGREAGGGRNGFRGIGLKVTPSFEDGEM